jgi:hypothetical protein
VVHARDPRRLARLAVLLNVGIEGLGASARLVEPATLKDALMNYRSVLKRSPYARRTLQNSENPTLNLGFFALMRFKLRAGELFEAAVTVRPLQPFGDSEGVLLCPLNRMAAWCQQE